MEQDAKDEISEDIIHDSLHDAVCRDCSNARLIDRQRKEIERLTSELEVERGRNRVLGFQIRTLREGK